MMMTSLTRPQTTTWPLLHQVAEVTGVVPAVLVLRGHETAHGDVAGRQRLTAQLDDADAAGRQHVAVLVDDAGLQALQQRSQRGQPAGVALGAGTARRSAASRSASTSSTTRPAPHSENDTASVVSAMP